MIQLRDQQVQALQQSALERYITEVCNRIRARHPVAVGGLDDDTLHASVRDQLDRARGFDITGRHDIEVFIDFTCVYGASFPEGQEWAAPILNDPGLDGSTKVTRLELHELWQRRD